MENLSDSIDFVFDSSLLFEIEDLRIIAICDDLRKGYVSLLDSMKLANKYDGREFLFALFYLGRLSALQKK